VQTNAILAAMTSNTNFPSPTPPLATIQSTIDSLETEETAVLNAHPRVAQRDVLVAQLLSQLHLLKAYVQQVADADPANAPSIIVGAGMAIKKPTSYSKPDFEVVQGQNSGTVELSIRSVSKRAAYYWQQSLDSETWSELPETLQAKTTVTGLKPGATYYFRYATLTKNGKSDWSRIVSIIVV